MKFYKFLIILILIVLSSCQKQEPTQKDEILQETEKVEVVTEIVEPEEVKPNFKQITVINEFINTPNNIKRKKAPEFMQGLYVTAYATRSARFDSLLENARNSGINTIVFDVKEMQGDVYVSLKDHPQIKYLNTEPFLNINRLVEKIHSYGFYAVARMVQFYNVSTATKHPHLQIKHVDGGYWTEKANQPAWLDSSHPEVQADLLHLMDVIASTNVDEIQMDYVRFPTEGRLSNAIFYFEEEDDFLAAQDSLYVRREKRDIIRDFVRQAREVCDRHNVKLSADIFAIVAWQRAVDIRNTGQDIAFMSPYLHHLHPMIYSSHFSDDFAFNAKDFINKPYPIVRAGIEKTIAKTHKNCVVIPYLQAFGWRVDYNREYMFDQLKASWDSGSKGYIMWNAASRYDKALSWIKEWNYARKNGVILEGYPLFKEKTKEDTLKIDLKIDIADIKTEDKIDIEI